MKLFWNTIYGILVELIYFRDLALLRASALFDKGWYLGHNPDVAQAKQDPALHYLRFGGFEGRDPGPNFSGAGYLNKYSDVKRAGLNPLVHYLKYGLAEGRQAVPPEPDLTPLQGAQRHHLPPDFMVIGAQKAGTTALYQYLSIHPGIAATEVKEHHFFNCEKNYAKGLDYYQTIFPVTPGKLLTFDASAGYLMNPNGAGRIHDYKLDVKIIALLRNPVERAYSAWQMHRKKYETRPAWFFTDWVDACNETIEFKKRGDNCIFDFRLYIEEEISLLERKSFIAAPVVRQGFYAQQLDRYYKLFPKEQILVIHSEDLRLRTRAALDAIQDFIGVAHYDYTLEELPPVFVGGYTEKMDGSTRSFLSDYYKPHNDQLFDMLGTSYEW